MYAQSLNLILIPLSTPYALHVFNDCESASDWVTHYVLLNLLISNHFFNQVLCYVTQLHADSLVLDLPWLWDHKVIINCEKDCLVFNSIHCHQQCISVKTVNPCVLKALLKLSRSEPSLNICIVSAASIICLAQRRNHKLFVTSLRDIEKALAP